MTRRWLLPVLLTLSACSQPMPAPSGLNVSGTWTGTFADANGPYPSTYTLQLAQGASDSFSGQYSGNSVSGTIAGSVGSGKSTITTSFGTVALQGAFTTNSYEGSFTTQPSGSAPVQSGTFSFSKAQ